MVKNSLKALCLIGLFLYTLNSFGQKVENLTVSIERTSISAALQQIEDNHPIRFFYTNELIQALNTEIQEGDYKLINFLNEVSTSTGCSYIVRDNYFIILFKEESKDVPVSGSRQTLYTFGSAILSDKDTVSLQGIIRDGQSEEQLIGAIVSNGNESTVTDYRGGYSLKMPTGYNRVTIRYVGFEPLQLDVEIYDDAVLDVNLYESSVLLDEVVVTDKADDIFQQTLSGVEKLTMEDISKIPSVLGEQDVVKSLLSLPGVTTVGEAGGGYNVRGGSAGQNLVLVDGITIFNPVHLFGFLSTFNEGIVKDATLYRGGIPSQYGGWASSVLNTTTLSSLADTAYHAAAKVGLISSGASLRGPVIKNKAGFVASYRSAYPNWLLNSYPDPDVRQSDAYFSEFYLKGQYRTDDGRHFIGLTGYRSFDEFAFGQQADYQFSNTGFSLRWDNQLSEITSQALELSYSSYNSVTIGTSNGSNFSLDSEVEQQQTKYTYSKILNDKHEVSAGIDNLLYWVNPGDLTSPGDDFIDFQDESAAISALFVEDNWSVSNDLRVIAGLRFSSYFLLGDRDLYSYGEGQERRIENTIDTIAISGINYQFGGLEPRVSLSYTLNQRTALKLSFQRSQQFLNRITNTVAISPVDVWKLSDDNTAPVISDRIVIGMYRRFLDAEVDLTIESYYTNFQNLIEYKNGSSVLLNPRVETELLQGTGSSYGVEVLAKRESGDLTGWASYTYSRSLQRLDGNLRENTINNGVLFPTNYDIPHSFNTVLNYDLSRVFDLSLSFTYLTGRPVTLPEIFYEIDGTVVPDFDQRNNYRLPDYHRLDLSLNWDVSKLRKRKSFRSHWNFTIYNLYGRDNVFSQFVSPAEISNRPDILQLSILPQPIVSISYNLKLN